jgi:hypothetical protein
VPPLPSCYLAFANPARCETCNVLYSGCISYSGCSTGIITILAGQWLSCAVYRADSAGVARLDFASSLFSWPRPITMLVKRRLYSQFFPNGLHNFTKTATSGILYRALLVLYPVFYLDMDFEPRFLSHPFFLDLVPFRVGHWGLVLRSASWSDLSCQVHYRVGNLSWYLAYHREPDRWTATRSNHIINGSTFVRRPYYRFPFVHYYLHEISPWLSLLAIRLFTYTLVPILRWALLSASHSALHSVSPLARFIGKATRFSSYACTYKQ